MVVLAVSTDAPVVVGPPQGHWTYADWEALPDDGSRYEIIDGVLYGSASPSLFHQWIIQQLYERVGIPARQQGLAYVFLAPVGVLMPGCEPVQPDFVLVRAERASELLVERRIRGVPDVIVEVLSPGNMRYDTEIKRAAYARAGVPEYAIIDPAARQVWLFRLDDQGAYDEAVILSGTDSVTLAAVPGIAFPVEALFAGAPDTSL